MKVRFHPVFDNPVRMSHFSGWRTTDDLVERLGDLEHAVGEGRIVPAPWEPYYQECPSCRHAGTYRWAQSQLQNPAGFAQALALFPGEPEQLNSRVAHANWLILSTKSEPSRVTRRLMLTEALGLWEHHAADWLEKIVETCAGLGVETSVALLHQQVQQALQPLAEDVAPEEDGLNLPDVPAGLQMSRGFDKELLHMDGWTPDPGLVILPVDGKTHALTRQILRLDLGKVVLLRARRPARTVAWEKITLVYLVERAVTFEIADEPPLMVAGYEHPEQILAIVQECYKAATERILQALATKVTRPRP
ncbi:MAG TPA: hypothetical protein VJA21_14080 [Verrucomicrobiae bacterium]